MGNGTIIMPDVPILGMPAGSKQAGQRVDHKPGKFDLLLETQGYLLLWERAARCPCEPVTDQTEQVNPNCELCKGSGWIYFGPDTPQNLESYNMDDLQNRLIQDSGGSVIRGYMRDLSKSTDPVDALGNWESGDTRLTVRYGNKLGYYDRITSLDSNIVYAEIKEADGSETLDLRYPTSYVSLLRSVDTVYKRDTDYFLEKGRIKWYPGKAPAAEKRLSAHYFCHPRWLVMDHPHSFRTAQVAYKVANPRTPTGDPAGLPSQAMLRYEFLVT